MNTSEIYSEAVGRLEVPKNRQQEINEQKEANEQKELRYINFNLQPTTREIISSIEQRMEQLDTANESLALSENNSFIVNRNINEKSTLKRILTLIKTGNYPV